MTVRTAIIPVAGLGSRFLPITKSVPKEFLAVVDTPLIQYVVEEAWAAGIEQIVLVTSRSKSVFLDHFVTHTELESALIAQGKEDLLDSVKQIRPPSNGTISAVRQNEPLGLGHAVFCARPLVGNEPFAVLLPDDLIWVEKGEPTVLEQMVTQFDELGNAMVAVMEVDRADTDMYGIIDPAGVSLTKKQRLMRIKGVAEKPGPHEAPSQLAIIGRYILTPEIFDLLAVGRKGRAGEIQLTDAIESLLDSQPVHGYRFHGTRYDCGDKAGYQMANLALSLHRSGLRTKLLPFIKDQLSLWQDS